VELKKLHSTTVAAVLGMGAAGLVLAGTIFVWSGIYNVAASSGHLRITTWLLAMIRERSIDTRSFPIKVPPLGDDGMIRLGAAHYEGGCAPCHGRPGEDMNPIVSGMLPPPPNLTEVSKRRPPEEIFWIVKHGLKYTGMPAWPNTGRDDEVWAVTAFLAALPGATGEYPDFAGLPRGGRDKHEGLANGRVFTRCGRCHEGEGTDTNGGRIPRLAGLPEAYLLRSLREYAERTRASGAMEPVADLLDEGEIRELAAYYSALRPARRKAPVAPDAERRRRGEAIATRGIPRHGVPACLSCHSGRQSSYFPTLGGQHGPYIAEQLRLWQRGGRVGTAYGRIMAVVAGALSTEQIEDVAGYLESLPPGAAPPEPTAEVSR
jgi:cytochrome c553